MASRYGPPPRRAEVESVDKPKTAPAVNSPPVTVNSESDAATSDYIVELRELAALRDQGILTEEEFVTQKKAILQRSQRTASNPSNPRAETLVPDPASASSTNDEKPINVVLPVYPARALSRGISGYVDFEFTISTEGYVVDPKIRFSSDKLFDRSAMRAIKKYKYDSRRAPTHGVTARIEFTLHE